MYVSSSSNNFEMKECFHDNLKLNERHIFAKCTKNRFQDLTTNKGTVDKCVYIYIPAINNNSEINGIVRHCRRHPERSLRCFQQRRDPHPELTATKGAIY